MGQEAARREASEVRRLRQNQKKLNDALRLLFDLLEEYAPPWYTEEHRDQAITALELKLDNPC